MTVDIHITKGMCPLIVTEMAAVNLINIDTDLRMKVILFEYSVP